MTLSGKGVAAVLTVAAALFWALIAFVYWDARWISRVPEWDAASRLGLAFLAVLWEVIVLWLIDSVARDAR